MGIHLGTSLLELGRKYGTDKADYHSYLPFYEELFKGRQIKRLLEIGIFKGASLRMWRDFLPEAEIYGFDIDPATLFHEEHIHTFQADQRSRASLSLALIETRIADQGFDVIIDDAFHEPQDQLFCANELFRFVEPGGVYIIEDIRQGNKEKVQEGLDYPSRVVEFDIERLPDDRLILIDKP